MNARSPALPGAPGRRLGPLLAARYSVDTPDASVTPDVPVRRTFEAQTAGDP